MASRVLVSLSPRLRGGSWVCAVGVASSLLGCATAQTHDAPRPASAQARAQAQDLGWGYAAHEAARPAPTADPWPLCGVLTEQGYRKDDELTFVVPKAPQGPEVERFNAIDATGLAAPLSVYAGWWICITRGRLATPIVEGAPSYGVIEVLEFTIDQSTGERGQE